VLGHIEVLGVRQLGRNLPGAYVVGVLVLSADKVFNFVGIFCNFLEACTKMLEVFVHFVQFVII
jgi:hypothetical protein